MIASNALFRAERLETIAQSKVDAVGHAEFCRIRLRDGQALARRCRSRRNAPAAAGAPRRSPGSPSRFRRRHIAVPRVGGSLSRYSVTTNSDSGRGISTSGDTAKVSEKNSLRPTR